MWSCESLGLEKRKPDLTDWEEMVESLRHPDKTVNIAMVGKYTQLHDAYLSVVEALKHGGIACKAKVEITWIDSEELNEKNLDQRLVQCRRNPGAGRLWHKRNRRHDPGSTVRPRT